MEMEKDDINLPKKDVEETSLQKRSFIDLWKDLDDQKNTNFHVCVKMLKDEATASEVFDFLQERGIIYMMFDEDIEDATDNETAVKSKDICGVSYYRKYGDKYTFWTNGDWNDLKFDSYEDYREFTMCLVYLLAEARKKFEKDSSERMRAEEKAETEEKGE